MAKDILQLIVDYGTRNLCAAAYLTQPNQSIVPDNIRILNFTGTTIRNVAQDIGFVKDSSGAWNFAWGNEFQEHIRRPWSGRIVPIRGLKGALLGQDEKSLGYRKDIADALAESDIDMTIEDVFVEHAKAIRRALFASLDQIAPAVLRNRTKILWAVPENVSLAKRFTLALKLHEAGFRNILLVSETESAGAWRALKYVQEASSRQSDITAYQQDDEIVVVDAGGWTVNIASYFMLGPLSHGARLPLRATGHTACEPYGSESISQQAVQWCWDVLVERYNAPNDSIGNLESWLGVTPGEYAYSICTGFENFKYSLQGERARTIKVERLDGRETQTIHLEITRELLDDWLVDAVEKIKSLLENFVGVRTKALVLTGGFFRNPLMAERLQSFYSEKGINVVAAHANEYGDDDLPVVSGAIMRFEISQEVKKLEYALGMPEDEYFDRGTHSDVDNSQIQKWRCDRWVADRWIELVPLGLEIHKRDENVKDKWLEILFENEQVENLGPSYLWSKVIYWTDQRIEEHEAIDGKVNISLWESCKIQIPIPRSAIANIPVHFESQHRSIAKKRKKKRSNIGRRYLFLRIRVVIQEMSLRVEVGKAPLSFDPYRNSKIMPADTLFPKDNEVENLYDSCLAQCEAPATMHRRVRGDGADPDAAPHTGGTTGLGVDVAEERSAGQANEAH